MLERMMAMMMALAAGLSAAANELTMRECFDGRPDIEWLDDSVRDAETAFRLAKEFHAQYPFRLMGYRHSKSADGVAGEILRAIERATGYRAASCLVGDEKDVAARFAAQGTEWRIGATYAENADGTKRRIDFRPPPKRRWVLDWADEFNGDRLDTSRWSACDCWHGEEEQFYTSREKNVRVENGCLVLEAHRERFDTQPTAKAGLSLCGAVPGVSYDPKRRFADFTSGCVVSAKKAAFTYGRIEIRAKIPTVRWSWPALWMMGENIPRLGWPRCGEIDIMEYWGRSPGKVFGTCHFAAADSPYWVAAKNGFGHVGRGDSLAAGEIENGFHVYAIEWSRDRIDFYFDDVLYYSFSVAVAAETKGGLNPFRHPMYLLLNYALDPGVGKVPPSLPFPQRMEIDYVRHYSEDLRAEPLADSAWQASEWISVRGAKVAGDAEKRRGRAADGTSAFRTVLANPKPVRRVRWMTAGLGVYELYANGVRVGEDFLKPGFTHSAKTKRAFTYDVTRLVDCAKGAANAFGAEVGAGWWRDQIVAFAGKKSAFRGVLEYTYEDGSVELKGTRAETWEGALESPVTHSGIFDGEEYDARIVSRARLSGALPLKLGTCERNAEFKGEILPSDGAEVTLRNDLAIVRGPFALKRGETKIVDFGQNCAAVPRFRFRAKVGTVLTALPGEMLNDADKGQRGCDGPKGSVYRQNLRCPANGMRVCYTFAGNGTEAYLPRFTFFGYRYIALSATDDVEIESVESVPVTSIAREMETGKLETGHEAVNRFIANVYWGQLSNYLSVPTDCPQRNERLGWSADTQVFTEAGAYNADTRGFFRKWTRDLRDSVDAEGGYPSVAPRAQYGNDTWKLGWADAGVIVPWTVWKMFGDTEIVRENFEAMAKFVRRLDATQYDLEPKIGYNYADWLSYEKFESCGNQFGSWREWGKDPDAMNYRRYLAACYWLYDARLMAQMADAIGRGEDAAWFRASAARALAHIRGKFLERDGLLLKPFRELQTACVFALKHGIVEGAAKAATMDLLKKSIREHGDCLQTGFLGTSFLMDALSENGETALCYTLLLQRKNPSWLYSVDQGATTIWERWNSYTKKDGFGPSGMNSFNHYAYGQVLGWMYRNLGGIAADPAAPGFRRIVMKPLPDRRLGHVTCEYRSAAGLIRSAWRYEGDTWIWEFVIPEGATGVVTLPGEKTAKEYPAGAYRLEQAAAPTGEVFEMKARASMTPVELNRGDVCRFTLRNGETRTVEYLGAGSSVLEVPCSEGLVATLTMTLRVDGVSIPFRRYFATQESFYEPAVVDGLMIWPDSTLGYLVDTVPMRYPAKGAMRHHPWKDARIVLQDATLSLCPEKLHPWFDDVRFRSLFLPIADCYHGGDCWLGPFAYGEAHGGMDLRMTRGDLLYAPFACDEQWMPLYAKKGRGGSSRWRGVRRFADGTLWSINTSHVIDTVVEEHTAVTNGQPYCTAAGTAVGDYDHTHFELHLCRDLNPSYSNSIWDVGWGKESVVRNDCPKGQPEFYNLDPWMLFWQTFTELRDERGILAAKIAPFAPAKTGERVVFRSARPIPAGGTATWTFNDGTSASGAEVSHVFAKRGAYAVTLTVFDGVTRARDVAIIAVSGEPVGRPMIALAADDPSFVELHPGDLPAWGERIALDPFVVRRAEDLVFGNRGGGLPGAVELRKKVLLADGAERRTYAFAGSEETTEVTVRPGANPGVRRTTAFSLHFANAGEAVVMSPCFWVQHHFDAKKRSYVTNGARAERGQFVRFQPNLAEGRWRVEETFAATHQPGSSYDVVVKDAKGLHRIRFSPLANRTIGEFDFAEGEGYVQIEAAGSVGVISVASLRFVPVDVQPGGKRGLRSETVAALGEIADSLAAELARTLDAAGESAAFDPDEWFFVSVALPKRCTGNRLEQLFARVTDAVAGQPVLPARIAADGSLVPARTEELPVLVDAWSRSVCRMFYSTWQKALHVRWPGVFERTLRQVRYRGSLPEGVDMYGAAMFAHGMNGVGANFGGTFASNGGRMLEMVQRNLPYFADRDPDGRGRGLCYSERGVSESFRSAVRADILSGKLKAEGPGVAQLLQASLDADETAAVAKLRQAVARMKERLSENVLTAAQTVLAVRCALSGTCLAEYY